VQPQEVRTELMDTSDEVMFVSQNENRASVSPRLLVYSFCSASHFNAVSGPGT